MPDIHFECPKCSRPLDAPDELANQLIECPDCKETINVPSYSRRMSRPLKPPEPVSKPAPNSPAPARVPEFKLPEIEMPVITIALTFIAVLEFIGAAIGGLVVGSGYDGNTELGWLIFGCGVLSGLIFLGFARVIDYAHESSQRLHRIELLIQRASEQKTPPNTSLEPTATAPSGSDAHGNPKSAGDSVSGSSGRGSA